MTAVPGRKAAVPPWAGVLLGLGAPVPAALGWLLFVRWTPAGQGARDVRLQLAGSRSAAEAVIAGRADGFRASLDADLWLIAGYALTLAAAGLLGGYVFTRAHWRLTAVLAGLAGVLAGACDLAEDVLLDAGLGRSGPGPAGGDAPFAAAAAFATVKWLLLLPAGAVAAVVCAATVHRAVRGLLRRPPEDGGERPDGAVPTGDAEQADQAGRTDQADPADRADQADQERRPGGHRPPRAVATGHGGSTGRSPGRPAGTTPPGCRRAASTPGSASASPAAASARPASPSARSRRSAPG
ncbi:hypothetical protein [Kitasatospora sp. NPDC093806]|uniref:hypothetical protein n=1 Tax=Kitasatospora sp. NPDC093806 TaxID=3155075 RepID=UPI003430369C